MSAAGPFRIAFHAGAQRMPMLRTRNAMPFPL